MSSYNKKKASNGERERKREITENSEKKRNAKERCKESGRQVIAIKTIQSQI